MREGEKGETCYTSFALSDLDVSGGLPLLIKAIQPGTDSPKPLQRNHVGSHDEERFPVMFWVVVPDGYEPDRQQK